MVEADILVDEVAFNPAASRSVIVEIRSERCTVFQVASDFTGAFVNGSLQHVNIPAVLEVRLLGCKESGQLKLRRG